MIVEDPPYELVILFADADAQEFFKALIERGPKQGCVKEIRWRHLRDPRRDASTCRNAARELGPFIKHGTKLVVIWDHEGSGLEGKPAEDVEGEVRKSLVVAGASESEVEAIALVPELEDLLRPVWDRVVALLAEQRIRPVPMEHELLVRLNSIVGSGAPATVQAALRSDRRNSFRRPSMFLTCDYTQRCTRDLPRDCRYLRSRMESQPNDSQRAFKNGSLLLVVD